MGPAWSCMEHAELNQARPQARPSKSSALPRDSPTQPPQCPFLPAIRMFSVTPPHLTKTMGRLKRPARRLCGVGRR